MRQVQHLRTQQRRVQMSDDALRDAFPRRGRGGEDVQGLEVGDRQGMGEGYVRVEAEGVEDLAFDVEDDGAVLDVGSFGEVVLFGVLRGGGRGGERGGGGDEVGVYIRDTAE